MCVFMWVYNMLGFEIMLKLSSSHRILEMEVLNVWVNECPPEPNQDKSKHISLKWINMTM